MNVASETRPLVAILMGSDSDWPVMQAAARMLDELGVPYEARVVSAHRTPDLMFDYAERARERGLPPSSPARAVRRTCRACWPPRPPCPSSACRCPRST